MVSIRKLLDFAKIVDELLLVVLGCTYNFECENKNLVGCTWCVICV